MKYLKTLVPFQQELADPYLRQIDYSTRDIIHSLFGDFARHFWQAGDATELESSETVSPRRRRHGPADR